MDLLIAPDDQTADQALNELEAWAKEPSPTVEFAKPEGSANEPNAPATEAANDPNLPAKTEEGTPKTEVTPQKPVEPTKPEATKPAEPNTPKPAEGSKFAKDQARRYGSWDELNKTKAEFQAQQQAAKDREAVLAQREAQIAQREAKLSAPKHPPEAFDAKAAELESNAQRVKAEIARLEDAGEFANADRLRDEQNPDYLRRKAKEFRDHAAELRANPPKPDPTHEQEQAAFKAAQVEWWNKAAKEFPQLAVEGTPERVALVQLLKSEPGIVSDPKGMYYASRLVAAETSALRVPTLVKDLETAQARIKELETLVNVPNDGSVPTSGQHPRTFDQMSPAEQLAQLEQDARGMSAFG